MNTKFTKGPWIAKANESYFDIGTPCAFSHNGIDERVCIGVMFEQEANARLIACAPDMYEMLEALKEDYPLSHPISMKIDQLLKRARGE